MSYILKGKTILVAGAGGLLGASLVKEIIEQGGFVFAVDSNIDLASERLAALNISKEMYKLECLDITQEGDVVSFFNKDILIDGAVNTTYPRNKDYGKHFFDVTLSGFNDNVSLHLGSSFLFSQQCASYFKNKKRAFSLVNISSVYGVIAPRFNIYQGTTMTMPVEYAAIKSAILNINKYIVSYINDSLFRINSVSPGGIFDGQPSSFLDAYKNYTMGAGMLDVKSVLGSIIFLLSDASRNVTCQNIIVDDGFSL